MRTIVAWALGAVVVLGVSTTVEAKKPAKKPKQYAARQARSPADSSQWHARDASQLPFGSTLWWDQMLRENRLTCCN